MEITKKNHGTTSVYVLKGRLEQAGGSVVDEAVKEWLGGNQMKLALDCQELLYVSSAGLRTLLMAAKAIKKAQREFVLFGLQPVVRDVFKISGFDQIISIVDDEASATSQAA